MQITILKETAPNERRVAATPETVKKFIGLGATVAVESGAGLTADMSDADYEAAGARVAPRADALAGANLVLAVQGPDPTGLPKGALLAASLNPYQSKDRLQSYAAAGIDAIALEFVPRITRAQSMDILSSQANLAGYKAVIDAAEAYGRSFPMMMTAAGTVPAARAFIMGVGVAGLQAIATAKRLGAVVSATDVRLATKEQILSLGGKPIFIEDEETKAAETSGGYAKEMSDAYKAKQAALVSETIAKQDIVITTALIPGRPAPRLVTAEQVATMKAGSVIVDMSVSQGGNVEGSKPDEAVVTPNGVTILGFSNYPSRMASTASSLFARNLLNFVQTFWDKDGKALKLPDDDEIIAAARVVKSGEIVHPALKA
jgi:NAD(P) transhydrogenase subunit alpha